MKRGGSSNARYSTAPFSILERIDVGETLLRPTRTPNARAFSILERIDVGETNVPWDSDAAPLSFSILERIDVGETLPRAPAAPPRSVSFQYPRTDRRG